MPTDEVFVVETVDGDVLLGQLEFGAGEVVVMNGFVGRPSVIAQDEIASILPASDHPDVED